jgi:hypothetical protein
VPRSLRAKDQRRVPVSLRIAPETHQRILDLVAKSGRSVTAEIEARVEQTLRDDDIIDEIIARQFGRISGDLVVSVFGMLLGAIAEVSRDRGNGEHWLDDPDARSAIAQFMRLWVSKLDGAGEPERQNTRSALALRDVCVREMSDPTWLAQRRERQGHHAEWVEGFVRDLQRWVDTGPWVLTTRTIIQSESEEHDPSK